MSGHILPTRIYYTIFGILMLCTFLTVQIASIDLGALNTVAALGIAVFKAVLVVLFFMHDYRFSNDRIWAAQIEFPFPLEVPLAGSISFNIAEIADVTRHPRRPVVVLMRRIEMPARRHCIRRRAIAFLVYVDTVLARFEVLDVGNDAHFVASLCERDRASYLAP